MSRRLARKGAFKALYSTNYIEDLSTDELIDNILHEEILWIADEDNDKASGKILNDKDKAFFTELLTGTLKNIDRINEIIELNLKSWNFSRIAKVDLAILQLAVYEITFKSDVPHSVAINEAVELGKEFGTDDSGSFINGILGKIVKDHVD